jgi:predicted ATP-dependent serine protease
VNQLNIPTANEYPASTTGIIQIPDRVSVDAVIANKQTTVEPACEPTTDRWRSLGVLSPADVNRLCDEEMHTQFLVEGFLPTKSIAIAAGDSTIGKSPLMYQLGLSVAAGVPFLGRNTNQGRVLCFDLENSLHDSRTVRDALVRFLGLEVAPENFLLATEPLDLERVIAEVKPFLVIIDSLRAFAPKATTENPKAAEWLNNLKQLAREYGVCYVIVHHLRKPGDLAVPSLDDETRVSQVHASGQALPGQKCPIQAAALTVEVRE